MNRFWEWMEKKEYGYSDDTGDYLLNEEYIEEFPYQMLIGYMQEYITENMNRNILNNWCTTEKLSFMGIDVDEYYELLKETINKDEWFNE